MSRLTKDDVELQWKEIENFEQAIPGIRYGEDYPEFALAIVGSEAFSQLVSSSTMLGMLSAIVMSKPAEKADNTEQGKRDFLAEMTKNSPMRELLLRTLYLGYKIGKRAA